MGASYDKSHLFEYVLRRADTCLVLGHRLSEWCGHGPVLEEDIALANTALDMIGQARLLLTYASEVEGKGRSEDDLAYLRDGVEYRNLLLVEQPNTDFAYTIARQLLFDAFDVEFNARLAESNDPQLAGVAAKALKESTYHLRHSGQWLIRLGDGTPTSHEKIQIAVDELWPFVGEMFEMDEVDIALADASIGVDVSMIKPIWDQRVGELMREATLDKPEDAWNASGGKAGRHSEHLGLMLAEMQYLQRAHPGATW